MLTQLQAYDSHCNLVLGEVEETIYVVDDEDDEDEECKVSQLPQRAMRTTQLTFF